MKNFPQRLMSMVVNPPWCNRWEPDSHNFKGSGFRMSRQFQLSPEVTEGISWKMFNKASKTKKLSLNICSSSWRYRVVLQAVAKFWVSQNIWLRTIELVKIVPRDAWKQLLKHIQQGFENKTNLLPKPLVMGKNSVAPETLVGFQQS
jgi:hypothetical protein